MLGNFNDIQCMFISILYKFSNDSEIFHWSLSDALSVCGITEWFVFENNIDQ